MKDKENKRKCLCDNPTCAKCLGVNCEDDDCKVHSIYRKIRARERILTNQRLKEDEAKKIKKETSRLREIRNNLRINE